MASSRGLLGLMLVTALSPGAASARSFHGGFSHHHVGFGHGPVVSSRPGIIPFAVGGGAGWWFPGYYSTIGPYGPVTVAPMLAPLVNPVVVVDRGPVGGPMPKFPAPAPAPAAQRARKPDPGKAAQLTTIGDRLFRAHNYKRAEERYEQAIHADPNSAAPRVRLAQIALVRGQYAEAAEEFRKAIAAEPNWLAHAPDIQTIFAEPSDFSRPIAKLESHLLIEPTDRDGWLVLGAELYLTGQTRRASAVFLRLTDRKPDAALAAFLDVANPPPDPK
jgi:hypothetical protein